MDTRKNSIIYSLLAFLTVIVFISCNKEDMPKVKPDPLTMCAHDSLVYVAAVEPTNTECGCVEHYYCSSCSKYYSDPECKKEIESPIVWGKYLVLGADGFYELFDKYYNEFGFKQAMTGEPETNFVINGFLKNIIIEKCS